MQRLEESLRRSDGIAIRSAYDKTIDGLRKSHSAVGSQLAIQYTNDSGLSRKLQNILSRKQTLDFKDYNQMVSAYFEALAQAQATGNQVEQK
jgi:hypothetical protein